MSSTVARALALLSHFSPHTPEIGLTELAKYAGVDKTTVYRLLVTLTEAGFVEQDPDTKKYRLGAGLLRLARVREVCFPVRSLIDPELAKLTQITGETAHASLLGGTTLGTTGICSSPKSSRVSLDDGQVLPLHCTASGQVVLAFCSEKIVDSVLSGPLHAHTTRTEVNPQQLRLQLADIRQQGFAEVNHCYEDDVHGIAAPLFDAPGRVIGAIAVATPTHRMSDELHNTIVKAVQEAATHITQGLGGEA